MTQGSTNTALSVLQHVAAIVLAAGMTLAIVMFLPVMQSIRDPIPRDLVVVPTYPLLTSISSLISSMFVATTTSW